MFSRKKSLLLSASAGACLLFTSEAMAQSNPNPYLMADGSRTRSYDEAVESWRTHLPFTIDYSKAYLGLEHAYARGLSGKGVGVSINDSGIYWDHPLFTGRAKGLDTGASDALGNNGSISTTEPWHLHGTHVAGTAAGSRLDGGLMFGVAYGADLYASTIHFVGQNYAFGPDYFAGGTIASGIDNLLATASGRHARIINNSWGVPQNSLLHSASLTDINTYFDTFREQITSLTWDEITRNDALVVMSAGNDDQFHASLWNMTPHYVPEVRGHFVTVTNYGADDLPFSSSLCGAAATWCLAGPGIDILSSIPDFSFDAVGWNQAHDYMDIIRDEEFFARFVSDGLPAAIDYRNSRHIDAYIQARDLAAQNGAAFDAEAEMRKLAENLSAFSQSLLALYINPKSAIGSDISSLTISLDNRLDDGLTAREAAFISQAFNDDFLLELNRYMGEVTSAYAYASGTSMAAPNITGFAALLMEQFPEYNTPLITDIMLSSGRDIEEAGVDIRAGWGVPQMGVALDGPSALRAVREVRVAVGTIDLWSNDISDAIDKYSPLVLERNPDDIGGLIKLGGGELVLTGTNTYSGETRVTEGLLSLEGSLTRSSLTVESLGILGGTGRVAALNTEAGGVVAPGNQDNPFGTLTVTGDAHFAPGSFLWVRANTNASQFSKLAVAGMALLDGGQVIVKADTGTWNLRRRGMEIVNAQEGVKGSFDGATSDLAFLTPSLSYQDRSVFLQLVRNDVPIASAGTTNNGRNTGAALDIMTAQNSSGDLGLEDAILDGSFEAVQAALPLMTGEVHPALSGLTTRSAGRMREAMLDRGRALPEARTSQEALNGQGLTAWASLVVGSGEFDGNADYSPYSHQSNGFVAGIDRRLPKDSFIGAAISKTRDELDSGPLMATGKATTTQMGIYGGTTTGRLGLQAGATWIGTDVDTTRTLALNAFSNRLMGAYEGDGWQVWAEASTAFTLGSTALEPYLNYTRYTLKSDVVETGGDAALKGQVRHEADLMTAGVRTHTRLTETQSGLNLKLVGHLAYTQDLADKGPRFAAQFADGPVFTVVGPQPYDGAVSAALGLKLETRSNLDFELGYSGLYQSDLNDHRLLGQVSWRF